MGRFNYNQLKNRSLEEIQMLYEREQKWIHDFVPMDSELEVQRLKRLGQEVLEELIVPVEEVYVEALQVKYPIIDWEVYSEDTRRYWKIIRVGNHTEAYQIFVEILKKFDKKDMVKLWYLVKKRFNTTEPTDIKEKELWVELKRLFKPDEDDTLWKLQRYMHDPLIWRLYDTCGVHHVSSVRGHDIFMLVEKDYPLSKGVLMLMLVNKQLVETDSEMSRELLRKIFIQANRSRQGELLGIRGFYNLMLLVQGNMMNEVDIENLTIEQYLMLTQENQARGMARTISSRMITKDIISMTIEEYMEYEQSINTGSWVCINTILGVQDQPLERKKDPNDFNLSAPNSHHEDEEVSSDEDVDEWLNAEMCKRMTGQDKEEEEAALIDILKTLVEEYKSIYKKSQIKAPSSRTSLKDCGQCHTCNPDLSFYSGYDDIYGQEESGMLKQ
ncbi:hypothetical protein Tco_0883115 [Tanacetum coccineum]